MTVKELIRELQNVPEDAIVTYHPEIADKPYIVNGVNYNNATNTISFYGGDIFEFEDSDPCEYCEAGVCNGCCNDIPDDVDETNYDPYCGCDMYEVDEVW